LKNDVGASIFLDAGQSQGNNKQSQSRKRKRKHAQASDKRQAML
jgi:hypothetical protein